jgi:D-glycero-alpha-D-manno-heptose-7-phosphate kinase
MKQNIVHPLRIPSDTLLELEESLVLCDTGHSHESGCIHLDQYEQMQNADIQEKVRSNVDLTYTIRNHLLRGRLFEFGKSLNDAWLLKRQFSNKISNSFIDSIYDGALQNGAVGGKLLGAGGGGFLLFYAQDRENLRNIMAEMGLPELRFTFDFEGTKVILS